MNYTEAVNYIEETPKFTTKNSLDHTRKCLHRLGDPQKQFSVIHVAGTNGKGSTCAFVTSIMRESGRRCGLFTSPHLMRINERFQINEEVVSDAVFLEAFLKVKKLADELVAAGDYHPTYFEMLFLMGMVIFAEAGVEFVALETGLGGRLDATNSVEKPLACIITSISMDHMQYLGDTVEKIAGEKAGIIKPGVPVIYDGNNPAVAKVVEKRARELEAPVYPVTEADAQIVSNTAEGILFRARCGHENENTYKIPFIARYQVMNAALALTCMSLLRERTCLSVQDLKKGLADTHWQGRMETVLPGVIVDGAHNEDGVRRFVETAQHFAQNYSITLLFSAVSDKDYPDMIRTMCHSIHFHKVVVTAVGGYREVSCDTMAEIFRQEGCRDVEAIERVEDAFDRAYEMKGDGLMFCVGSLYLVGDIKAYIEKCRDLQRTQV